MDAVLQFQDLKYQNHSYLQSYFAEKGVLSLCLPLPPPRLPNSAADQESMLEYYSKISGLDTVEEALSILSQKHTSRIETLENMSTKAHSQIWYPFTQHREVSPSTIMTIDSASGDFFQTHTIPAPNVEKEEEILTPTFDGSASWWTQGLGHGNPTLSLAAAYAAGRYGHVMFAGTIHEPALELASTLLKNLDNPRLSKVFYSDNGSTGIEVATKMALTATAKRYGWEDKKDDIGVIGLKGSYHGDTIGAMDLSEPSTYNEKVHWYKGRGYWFDFPQVKMVKGKWRVEPCEAIVRRAGKVEEFESLGEIFDLEKRYKTVTAKTYVAYILKTLTTLVQEKGMRFGALIMEPVILGAGGMLFA
jgi:bifunctional dethiobiotin synthetase / adenosylmethionine---8-amino-7-oxononanoate aminotransferase